MYVLYICLTGGSPVLSLCLVCRFLQTFLSHLSTLVPVSRKHLCDFILINMHTYSINAKSSVDIDCKLKILYRNATHFYVYYCDFNSGTWCLVWTTDPKTAVGR